MTLVEIPPAEEASVDEGRIVRASTPRVGEVIRRLRRQRGFSLRDLAERSGLSQSFLGAVERGQSDISVGRLSQVAAVLGHDVASLLGYSLRRATPVVIRPDEHVASPRGRGVEFTTFAIPGTHLEFMRATLAPRSRFDDEVTHAGIDVMYVSEGSLVLVVDGVDYPLRASECAVWPSSHAHTLRNDGDVPAVALGFTTEAVHR
ncbi:MAG TPA: helix-turn-helix domain-containing protein [Gaiella sp.]|jgi:transcriptional regulator with XRE-family HTH domain